jgi:hypothetical protein
MSSTTDDRAGATPPPATPQKRDQADLTPPPATRQKRDWTATWTAIGALVVGAAAFVSIYFTTQTSDRAFKQASSQANAQFQIAIQQQTTDEYTTAITDLGSSSIDVRLGGIYLLQQLMDVSSSEQSTVVAVLCAFIRDQSMSVPKQDLASYGSPTDIQAALSIVDARDRERHGFPTVDLDGAQLINADLYEANLTITNLVGANLTNAKLNGAALTGASLNGANLTDANLHRAILTRANLTDANLTGAILTAASLIGANFAGANLTGSIWPATVPTPAGWIRDASTSRLKRAILP